MSSRTKVQEAARRVKTAIDHGEKLNALADAIHDFVDYIELIEHQIRQVETHLRRMEM
jgi:ATP-dependent protease HslVU (ClpYQ) peptidase subunit